MIVVKLGGSLYDHPALRIGLNRWLKTISSPVLFIPGGGALADGVREFGRLHNIGDEASHWAAIRSMAVAEELLKSIIHKDDLHFLDVYKFCREEVHLPHSWDVTSDSIALGVAIDKRADRLVLLKSQDRPAGSWDTLAEIGYVDRYFPILAKTTHIPIETMNFRRFLDDYINVEST